MSNDIEITDFNSAMAWLLDRAERTPTETNLHKAAEHIADHIERTTTRLQMMIEPLKKCKVQLERSRDRVHSLEQELVYLHGQPPGAIKQVTGDERPSQAEVDVRRERLKQRQRFDDDDGYDRCELAAAAQLLVTFSRSPAWEISRDHTAKSGQYPKWAFDLHAKHGERRDRLVIAAALLIAEIDRIDRDNLKKAAQLPVEKEDAEETVGEGERLTCDITKFLARPGSCQLNGAIMSSGDHVELYEDGVWKPGMVFKGTFHGIGLSIKDAGRVVEKDIRPDMILRRATRKANTSSE
jgi:hypothetical protein